VLQPAWTSETDEAGVGAEAASAGRSCGMHVPRPPVVQCRAPVTTTVVTSVQPRPWLDFNKMQKTCLKRRRSRHQRSQRTGNCNRLATSMTCGSRRRVAQQRRSVTPLPGTAAVRLDPAVFSFRSIWLTRQHQLLQPAQSSASAATAAYSHSTTNGIS
jgi:hypothetical protein